MHVLLIKIIISGGRKYLLNNTRYNFIDTFIKVWQNKTYSFGELITVVFYSKLREANSQKFGTNNLHS